MTDSPRRLSKFERLLDAAVNKLQAHRSEVEKAKRTKLTLHQSGSGNIEVELETKL